MRLDVEQYWIRALGILEGYALGTMQYKDYRDRLDALWLDMDEENRYFIPTTPFQYVPLSRLLLAARSEVTESEDEFGSPRDVAAWFFRHYFEIHVLGSRTYRHPTHKFGGNGSLLYQDEQKLSAGVKLFLGQIQSLNSDPILLAPEMIKMLHEAYLSIAPDSVVSYLCSEAMEVLLPWLSEGIMGSESLAAFETKEHVVAVDQAERYRTLIGNLDGSIPFSVALHYHSGLTVIRIS